MTPHITAQFHGFFTLPHALMPKLLLTICGGGARVDDPNAVPPPPRPRVSLGGIYTMLAVTVSVLTLFGVLWQSARYFADISWKLDMALAQGATISKIQNDLLVLETKFDGSQAQAERVARWLQNLSRQIDGHSALPPSIPTSHGPP